MQLQAARIFREAINVFIVTMWNEGQQLQFHCKTVSNSAAAALYHSSKWLQQSDYCAHLTHSLLPCHEALPSRLQTVLCNQVMM